MSDLSDIEEFYGSGDLAEYYDYHHEELAEDVWEHCVLPSFTSVSPTFLRLILSNFAFAIVSSIGLLPLNFVHFFTGCVGIFLINSLESDLGKLIALLSFIFAFILICVSYCLKRRISSHKLLLIVSVLFIFQCEYRLVDPEVWMQIRGVVMILAMKVISLSDEIQKSRRPPNVVHQFGYLLCGANVLFGPWISFPEYLLFCKKPTRKNLIWVCYIFFVVFLALFHLSLSNCWIGFLIGEESNRWFVAYKEALGFRTSHYFISYLSEAGMIAAGFYNHNHNSKRGTHTHLHYRYVVTEPMAIELPTSLSMVVRKWNQPMHDFLKKYVFRCWLDNGKFIAIFMTFLVSSLLHGLELKVSMVLITIGVFSYLQVAPREKLADIFDVCLKVRPCRGACSHRFKRKSFVTRFILFIYALTTIFHLAYLGILMDPSTNTVGIFQKWRNLYFVSHVIMFLNLLIVW